MRTRGEITQGLSRDTDPQVLQRLILEVLLDVRELLADMAPTNPLKPSTNNTYGDGDAS